MVFAKGFRHRHSRNRHGRHEHAQERVLSASSLSGRLGAHERQRPRLLCSHGGSPGKLAKRFLPQSSHWRYPLVAGRRQSRSLAKSSYCRPRLRGHSAQVSACAGQVTHYAAAVVASPHRARANSRHVTRCIFSCCNNSRNSALVKKSKSRCRQAAPQVSRSRVAAFISSTANATWITNSVTPGCRFLIAVL